MYLLKIIVVKLKIEISIKGKNSKNRKSLEAGGRPLLTLLAGARPIATLMHEAGPCVLGTLCRVRAAGLCSLALGKIYEKWWGSVLFSPPIEFLFFPY